jgi:aldose 1-epimerase
MKKSILAVLLILAVSCQQKTKKTGEELTVIPGMVKQENYQTTYKDRKTDLFTLRNKNGVVLQVTNYGAKIVTLFVPDKSGNLGDIVFGYEKIQECLAGDPYFGAVVGRYANRIAAGKFTLDGKEYQLPKNEGGKNLLHGGDSGFNDAVWTGELTETPEGKAVKMTLLSPDGDQGFPGNLKVEVLYTLTDKNELIVDYKAVTDKPTVINLSQHSYFNLAGHAAGPVLNHELIINADRFTPVDENLIPTGEIRPVEGTSFDFRTPHLIGERIANDEEQLILGKGYDHNFILNKEKAGELTFAASAYDKGSGRFMEVFTTHPAIQFYTGNFLDGSQIGKGGNKYVYRSGFCLETQYYPDSPNHPDFPSTVLRPGEEYKHRTVFKFSVK